MLELWQQTFSVSCVFANLWFYLMLMFNFKINCYMVETLDVAPFFCSIWKSFILMWHISLLCFSPCFWCGGYNAQPRKQLFATRKSKKDVACGANSHDVIK